VFCSEGKVAGKGCKSLACATAYNLLINLALQLTFGGMCSWRSVAVARVFALVMRCRVKRLLLYSRVGKNRDTRRGSPAGAGAACTAIEGFSCRPQFSRGAEANCIYRPVTSSFYSSLIKEKNLSLNFKDFLSLGKGI